MRDKNLHHHPKDDLEADLYSDMIIEKEDEAVKQKWKETPNAKPMLRPNRDDQRLLAILTKHKLMPQDSSLQDLKEVLESRDHIEKRAQMFNELESLPGQSDNGPSYAELAKELKRTFVVDGTPVGNLGNIVDDPEPQKRRATKADLKKIKKIVQNKRLSGEDGANTDDELEAAGLMPC